MEDATFGSWRGNVWSPFLCEIKAPDAERIASCFGGKRVAIMGDSQGVHTATSYAKLFGCKVDRTGSDCDEGPYFGIRPMARPENLKKSFGRIKDGCARCSACRSQLSQCAAGTTLEFITMELAQDHRTSCTNPHQSVR